MKTKATGGTVLAVFLLMQPAREARAAENPAAAGATPGDAVKASTLPSMSLTAPPNLTVVDPFMLEGGSFDEAVGRPDLAQRYRARKELKTTSLIVAHCAGRPLGLRSRSLLRGQQGKRPFFVVR